MLFLVKIFFKNNWLKMVAVIMLSGAVLSYFSILPILPSIYYQLMLWTVVISALMTSWRAYKKEKLFLMWLFVLVAIIYSPISTISLSVIVWQITNSVVAVIFLASFFLPQETRYPQCQTPSV